MNLDDIKYGNQPKEHEDKIKNDRAGVLKASIDKGIVKDILNNYPFPPNSSKETRKELDYLVKLLDNVSKKDLKFCKLIETNHYDFFVVVAKRLGLDVSKEQILKWVGDVDPVLFYLKNKFNRPRPYQLAKELNLPIYPIIRTDANSAAYPSGHTLDFLVILYHFARMKPGLVGKLNRFYQKIKKVRELSGVHYPSDRTVSEYLFKQLVKHKLIR